MENETGRAGFSWIDRILRRHDEFKFACTTIRMFLAFLVVALCSVVIRLVVSAMEWMGFPVTMTMPLTMVEYMILFADVVWFTRRLWMEIAESVHDMLPGKQWVTGVLLPSVFVLAAVLLSAMNAHPHNETPTHSRLTTAMVRQPMTSVVGDIDLAFKFQRGAETLSPHERRSI